jgi:hypothetical protein
MIGLHSALNAQPLPFQKDFVLQPGDLLFQDLDCGPLCDAIESVTQGYQHFRLSHVAIVAEFKGDSALVYEAYGDSVRITEFRNFAQRSADSLGRPKILVGRLRQNYRYLIAEILKQAQLLIGKPYDPYFLINNDKYYCSEFIFEAVRAANGSAWFNLEPMTFRDPITGQTLPAWEEYFKNLQVPIPENKLGLNPGSMSRCPVLEIIHAYGKPDRN